MPMSTGLGKLPDFITQKQSEAEAETLLRLSNVFQHSGVRGRGISKLIFENENIIRTLNDYSKNKQDPDVIMQLKSIYAHSIALDIFFKEISCAQKDLRTVIALVGCNCSNIVSIQRINRLYLMCIKFVDLLNSRFVYFESFLEDNELFFEDLYYAVEPYFIHQGTNVRTIEKPVPWIGGDLSDCFMSRRLAKQSNKRSKLSALLSWMENWNFLWR